MQTNHQGGKGIQQGDVWAAADSLVADGLRPTIERVRQKIGRGSPNTVSPMLEAWFGTLAARLGVAIDQEQVSAVPKAVQNAMQELWELALSSSRKEAELQVAHTQADLARQADDLIARERELIQKDHLRAAKQAASEQALLGAQHKAEDALHRLAEAQALTAKREGEVEGLRLKLAAMEMERDAQRHQADESADRYARERQKQENQTQAVQHKLLEEIDRARQEVKNIRNDVQMSEKRREAERNLAATKIESHEAELLKVRETFSAQMADFQAAREALAVSTSRVEELRHLMHKQQVSSEKTIAQLTDSLSVQAGRQQEGYGLWPRKIKRPVRTRK